MALTACVKMFAKGVDRRIEVRASSGAEVQKSTRDKEARRESLAVGRDGGRDAHNRNFQ